MKARKAKVNTAQASPNKASGQIGAFVQARKNQVSRNKMFAVLAAVVVLLTVWALVQPANALTCGKEAHKHGAECYAETLVCTDDHTHSDGCYEKTLTCTKEEHTHGASCKESAAAPASADDTDNAAAATAANNDDAAAAVDDNDDKATVPVAQAEEDESAAQGLDTNDLDGKSLALVNGTKKVAMTAEKHSSANRLLGIAVNGRYQKDEKTGLYELVAYTQEKMESYPELVYWTFGKTEGLPASTYLVTTEVNGVTKYLCIDGVEVKLVDAESEASKITVTQGTGTYADQVRLTNSVGQAINLYSGVANQGFGGYNDGQENEYFYLMSKPRLLEMPGIVDDAVSPAGTVINMFDYWAHNNGPQFDANGNLTGGDFTDGNKLNEGINAGHALKFLKGGDGNGINHWESGVINQGIVQNMLGSGYPILNTDKEDVNTPESLDYLFNPDTPHDGKITYRNVKGLLQVSEDGYYMYDSRKNFAELNTNTKEFTLYNAPGVEANGQSGDGQFFPYNKFADVVEKKSGSDYLNHHFGMTLTSRFVQKHNGHTDATESTDTVFEFTGDDDVWIFVDDVLVADLGGIRDYASVSINFATGEVVVTAKNGTVTTKTLRQMFDVAGKKDVEWSETESDTFANNTYHTLKFFYLERGNWDSNLKLKYNLASYPPSGIYKVNQYGDAVAGAEFQVFRANANYEKLDPDHPDYRGTTDASGQMVFVDTDGMPYTLAELKDMFGDHFVLEETSAPPGYRLMDIGIHLRIDNGVMLCDNTADSGVWTSPTLQVSAPNTVKLVDGSPRDIVDGKQEEKGRLFAVVLKYTGPSENGAATDADLANQANWAPVYGDSKNGYTVVDVSKAQGDDNNAKFLNAVIDTAKKYTESNNVFSLAASGAMQGGLEGMPGDIMTYYHMLPDQEKGKTKYTVAYYWADIDNNDLNGATAANTYRVDSEAGGVNAFERAFGATVQVPNYLNRLIVQKFSEDGDHVNGAKFAMYKAEELEGNVVYVADNDSRVELYADDDGDGIGEACIGDASCRYEVDAADGVIYVGSPNGSGKVDRSSAVSISPAKSAEKDTDGNELPLCRATLSGSDKTNPSKEDGSADFNYLKEGKYIIREISAPKDYKLNPAETLVYVTRNAIYANAGMADDGVVVARGAGYLANNMQQYASEGDINRTLSWIYSQMKISDETRSFSEVTPQKYDTWRYTEKQKAANWDSDTAAAPADRLTAFLKYNPDAKPSENSKGALFNFELDKKTASETVSGNCSDSRRLSTDIGWSFLELYQNYPYGSQQTGQYAYDDWYASGTKVLSHLFSGSVYVQVTDKYKNPYSVSIKKRDATTSDPLEGAVFTLTRSSGGKTFSYIANGDVGEWVEYVESDAKTRPTSLTTDKDGLIGINTECPSGTYTLTEVEAPSGYALPENKTFTFGAAKGKPFANEGNRITVENDDSSYLCTVTVKNSPGAEMPHTGGPGTSLYTLGGLLLIGTAVTCGFAMRRKREREGIE